MAVTSSVLQEQVGPQPTGTSSTTVSSTAFANNCTVGSTISAWIMWGSTSSSPTSVQDGAGQTYAQQALLTSVGLGVTLALYTLVNNQSAAKLQVTATWAASQTFRCCFTSEIGGITTNPIQGTPSIHSQANPGTTANAITANSVTPSPTALLHAFCIGNANNNTTVGTNNSPTAGANSSGLWGGAYRAASESFRLTSGSAITATFGNTNGSAATFLTGAALYTEQGVTVNSRSLLGVGS